MPSVFFNYRKGDQEIVAGLLRRGLSERFGREVFFLASDSIPPGDDFERALMKAVRTSDALLAIIGPHWLEARHNGHRKIDLADDWTRREIIQAFRHDVRVIPVFVGGMRPLTRDDLPAELAELAVCQYMRLELRSLEADLDWLATKLTTLVPGLRDSGPQSQQPGAPGTITNHLSNNATAGVVGAVQGDVTFENFGTAGNGGAVRPASDDKDRR